MRQKILFGMVVLSLSLNALLSVIAYSDMREVRAEAERVDQLSEEIKGIGYDIFDLNRSINRLPGYALPHIEWWKAVCDLNEAVRYSIWPEGCYPDWQDCIEEYLEKYGSLYGAVQDLHDRIGGLEEEVAELEGKAPAG